jgi:hypothetical protein
MVTVTVITVRTSESIVTPRRADRWPWRCREWRWWRVWFKTPLIDGEGHFAAEDDDGNIKGIQDIEDDDQELNVEEDDANLVALEEILQEVQDEQEALEFLTPSVFKMKHLAIRENCRQFRS